ncbi:hypothetical protein FK529_14500 [Tsukamurella asaccharolytica]|uniref:Cellulose-binding protein n=1 Tax=Tsukamurella asaccharolytica TaxID=2592067 RepID=A0A5C5R653_9ACTN|nr:hypothetical protein [Tsukamurella asaccharolytica]TWS18529.1 hypothetical protein FK529_14500 [Tsukamurella asaccharolytica]
MANTDNTPGGPAPAPFAVVLRGYDRDQVTEQFHRYQAELRVLAADRDAASAHARELTDLLDEAQDEIDNLRREVDRLSVPPTSAEGMSDRIARMMRLASDEASEIRAAAENESAEVRSLARQEAETTRREAEALLSDMTARREAMESEHAKTMRDAQAEAARIKAEAEAAAEKLAQSAAENRERVQNDFDLAMSMRRDKAIRTITELEDASKDEARDRIDAANERAEQTLNTANATAEQKLEDTNTRIATQVANARRITEDMQTLRASILDQLETVRRQLSLVPEALATGDSESQVIERRIDPAPFTAAPAPRAEHVGDDVPTAAQRAHQVLGADDFAADDTVTQQVAIEKR